MARIPYIPVPEAEASGPVGRGTPYQHVDVSPDAFGAASARGTIQAGQRIQQGSNELFAAQLRKQNLQNQTDADNATNQFEDSLQKAQFGDPNDPSKPGFYALKGSNATAAYQSTVNSLQNQRQQMTSTLTNPRAQHMFDQNTRRMFDYAQGNMGRHFDQEQKTFQIQTQQGTVDLAKQAISLNPDDEEGIAHSLSDGLGALDKAGAIAGAAPEFTQQKKNEFMGQVAAGRIDGYIRLNQYDKAQKVLDANGGYLPPSEQARLGSQLRTRSQAQQVESGAQNFFGQLDGLFHNAPQPNATGNVADKIIGAEGQGKNPNSSAQGTGQFIDSTMLDVARRNLPQTQGMSDQQVLAMRNDPATMRQLTQTLAAENASKLSEKGLPANDANLYLAHFAGADGAAKILTADPGTPVRSLLSPQALQKNPQVANMNAGQMQQWAAGKMQTSADQPTYVNKGQFYEANQGTIMDAAQQEAQREFPDNLDMQDKFTKRVQGHLETQIKQEKVAQTQDKNNVERWLNGDFTQGQKPTDLSQMPQGQVSDAYERMQQFDPVGTRSIANVLKANGKTDTGFGEGFYSLLGQVYSHQITDPTQLYPFAGSPVGVTSAGLNRLTQEMKLSASPQGASEAMKKQNFIDMARTQITQTTPEIGAVDPKGDERFNKFMPAFLAAYDQGKNQQPPLSTDEMLNPKSSHYLGNMIPSFAPTETDKLAQGVSATPEYSQNYMDTSTPQTMAQSWMNRINGATTIEQKQALWKQAREAIVGQFPAYAPKPAPVVPQAPLAQ